MPAQYRELFGWALREARHERRPAQRRDELSRHRGHAYTLEVADDGRGPSGTGSGHGLVGLAERVRAAGGTLNAGPAPGGGFRLWIGVAGHAAARPTPLAGPARRPAPAQPAVP